MTNYQEARVKLTNEQLNKSRSAAKKTTRQTTKTRNTFANNLSTDIKLNRPQISKIIQSG